MAVSAFRSLFGVVMSALGASEAHVPQEAAVVGDVFDHFDCDQQIEGAVVS